MKVSGNIYYFPKQLKDGYFAEDQDYADIRPNMSQELWNVMPTPKEAFEHEVGKNYNLRIPLMRLLHNNALYEVEVEV
jgi:hypothetical protein